MNNVLLYRKMISLLEIKLEEEIKNQGNRSFALSRDIGYQMTFASNNDHEYNLMNNLIHIIFGFRLNEIKTQIEEEVNEIRNKVKVYEETKDEEIIIESDGIIHFRGTKESLIELLIHTYEIASFILTDIHNGWIEDSEFSGMDFNTYKEFSEKYGKH